MQKSPIFTDPRELAAITSALLMLKGEMEADGDEFLVGHGMTNNGEFDALSPDEIGALYDQLTGAGPTFLIVDHLSFVSEDIGSTNFRFYSTENTWDDLSKAREYSFADMLTKPFPMGASPRWVAQTDLAKEEYRSLFKTRADLMNLPAFTWLTVDSAGNPCVWENHYECKDGHEFTDHWSCQVDEECPQCGSNAYSPKSSKMVLPQAPEYYDLWDALPEAE